MTTPAFYSGDWPHRERDCFTRPAPGSLEESFAAWKALPEMYEQEKASGQPISSTNITHTTRFSIASRPHTQGRKLALTRHGFLCLVPPLTEVGDIVCAFEHIRTPYLIRPVRTEMKSSTWTADIAEKDVFSLVGQCYVHGLMYGEESILKNSKWDKRRPLLLK
jgi:hypothetical protein